MSINENLYGSQVDSSLRRFKNTRPPVIYQPIKPSLVKTPTPMIDTNSFKNANKTEEELKAENDEDELANALSGEGGCKEDKSLEKDTGDDGNNMDPKTGKFNIFKILKIVPIGINILAKAPTLASGFMDGMMGLQKALVGISISSFELIYGLIQFNIQGFQLAFVLLLCFIENISNLNSCILFYLLDLIVLICYLALISLLALVDAAFLKSLAGISSVDLVLSLYDPIMEFSDFIFEISGVHVLRYPDYITKMCYTCSFDVKPKPTTDAGKSVINVVTNKIPDRMSGAMRKFSSAARKITSVFNL